MSEIHTPMHSQIFSKITASQLVDLINLKYSTSEPFLFSRYGHCESRIMGFPHFFNRVEVEKSINLQLGAVEISDLQISEISRLILDSFANSDVLGIPVNVNVKNDLDKLWEAILPIADHHSIDYKDKLICSPNTHIQFLEENLFPKLLTNVNKVMLITGRDVRDHFCKRFGLSKNSVDIIHVPQENRTSNRSKSLLEAPHFPDVFYSVLDRIHRESLSGTMCFFGAGFLGKIYGLHVKHQGGCAVDIGSVFDAWGDVMGRSFMNKHYLKKYAINGYTF